MAKPEEAVHQLLRSYFAINISNRKEMVYETQDEVGNLVEAR